MNDKRNLKEKQTVKRILLLCLCAALLCSAAFAETAEVTDMASSDKADSFYDYCMLPDGRTVFAGWMMDEESSAGRLVCMNPDGTVSWAYEEPAGSRSAYWGVLPAEDGTLAVSADIENESKVIFFSTEGQPSGKELPLQDEAGRFSLKSFGTVRNTGGEDGDEGLEFADREGNLLFRWENGAPVVYGQGDMIPEEDGLVLTGWTENGDGSMNAAILKADWQGKTVWETALPALTENGDNPALTGKCLRTGDGGYAARLLEYTDEAGTDTVKQNNALVRFDAEGQVLWMNRESFEKREKEFGSLEVTGIAAYKGKLVAGIRDRSPKEGEGETALYLWFDENGKELGTTEVQIRKEDLPRFADSTGISVSAEQLVSLESGLWQVFGIEGDSWLQKDNVMVRVPEL